MSTVEEILATPTSTQDKRDEALSDADRIKSGQVYALVDGKFRWVDASEKAEALASAFRELDEQAECATEAVAEAEDMLRVTRCAGCDDLFRADSKRLSRAFEASHPSKQPFGFTEERIGNIALCDTCVARIDIRSCEAEPVTSDWFLGGATWSFTPLVSGSGNWTVSDYAKTITNGTIQSTDTVFSSLN